MRCVSFCTHPVCEWQLTSIWFQVASDTYGDIGDYKGAGVMQAVVSGAKQLMNMMGQIMAAYGEGGGILLLIHASLS